MGVPAEDFEAVFAAGEFPGEVGGDDVELDGDRGEIGGGTSEEGAHRLVGGVDEGVVAVLVGLARGGVDGGLGGTVRHEGSVPNSDREGLLVIPAEAGIPGRRARSGSRWHDGGKDGRGADGAQQRPPGDLERGAARRLAAGGWNAAVRSTMLPVSHPSPPSRGVAG